MEVEYEPLLIDILDKHNFRYVKVDDIRSLKRIYELFADDVLFEPVSGIELLYVGNYFYEVRKNPDLMKKHYLRSIDTGNVEALYYLGHYYEDEEQNYAEMKKYYQKAVECGHDISMFNLGYYYDEVEKNYVEMKKYYLMALESGCKSSMYNMGYFYEYVEKNREEMMKYYGMAVDGGSKCAMHQLGRYYRDTEVNYDEMRRHYLMAIAVGHKKSLNELGEYYEGKEMYLELLELWIEHLEKVDRGRVEKVDRGRVEKVDRGRVVKLFGTVNESKLSESQRVTFLELLIGFEFKEEDDVGVSLKMLQNMYHAQVTTMQLHFNYSVEGKGFEDAKKDFIYRSTK